MGYSYRWSIVPLQRAVFFEAKFFQHRLSINRADFDTSKATRGGGMARGPSSPYGRKRDLTVDGVDAGGTTFDAERPWRVS